jgi:hypothetical protein
MDAVVVGGERLISLFLYVIRARLVLTEQIGYACQVQGSASKFVYTPSGTRRALPMAEMAKLQAVIIEFRWSVAHQHRYLGDG